jgi:hypothetical protein
VPSPLRTADPWKAAAGAPHMLIVRTPGGRLTCLQAIASRRKAGVGAGIPAAFTGPLITDGYTGYQQLLSRLAGIQQCCQHIVGAWTRRRPWTGAAAVAGRAAAVRR